MKKIVPVILGFIVYGCSLFVTRSLHNVVQTFDDFTLRKVAREVDATKAQKLFSGDVVLFAEFGADSCLVAEFSRGGERYTVEAVSFPNQKGALGAYTITDIPASYPVELGRYGRKSDTVMQFVKGNFIVSVLPSKDSSITGAHELARGLAKRIRGGAIKAELYEGLPQLNMVKGSEFFFMGPKAFKKNFSAELADVLAIEKAREGMAAKYQTDDEVADFIKIRYPGTEQTLEALNAYLKSRSDRPVILPREALQFYIVVEPDRSEVYIAEYAEWLYIMLGSPPDGEGQGLFEYVLRGGR